jgi:hypothetical protein
VIGAWRECALDGAARAHLDTTGAGRLLEERGGPACCACIVERFLRAAPSAGSEGALAEEAEEELLEPLWL